MGVVFAATIVSGCDNGKDNEGSGGETEGSSSTSASASDGQGCMPGSSAACACTDGSMGTQICADNGQSYGACDCGAGSAGSDSSDPSTTSDSTDGSTTAGDSSTEGGSTGGENTDSAGGCEPGTVAACDCPDGPGFAACNDAGERSPCECCVGEHPLVEGDTRYCEPGGCYCGDLQMDPPLDACYVAAVADVCCPIELVCYE